MRKWMLFLPLLVMSAALLAVAQDAQQPSLGDLARQQKAKEAKEAPTKVFTNDNLPANDGSVTTGATGATVLAPSPAAPEGAPAAGAPGKTAAAAKGKVDPEKVKEAQFKLNGLKNDMVNLEKNYKMLEEKAANATDDFQRDVYQRGLETRDSETAALQGRIAAAQKELEDAEKGEPTAAPAPAPPPQPAPAAENAPESGPPQ
jgi:hypothetical protein